MLERLCAAKKRLLWIKMSVSPVVEKKNLHQKQHIANAEKENLSHALGRKIRNCEQRSKYRIAQKKNAVIDPEPPEDKTKSASAKIFHP
jgi:hypothetical protein